MADLSKTVEIIFEGDDRVGKTITGISGSLESLGGKAVSATQPLADLAESAVKLEAALAAMVAGGLALAFAASTEFETSSVSLSKILGEQSDMIGEVEGKMIGLSNEYGIGASALLDSTTDFKRAGFEVVESMGLVETAVGLMIGASEAELDMARATEIIIATLKGFKAPAEEAGRLTDILNKVSNEYATSVSELGTGMANLSPVAAKMGFSFEETAGILTPVIEIFRSGDEASVALRTGLLKLIDDAKPVRDALAAIGVSQANANGSLRSGRDILFDVAEAFQTADKDQKLFLAAQLVGIRQAAKMVEVFDGLAYTTEITNVALAASGSIATEVAARLETAQISVDRFKTGFVNLGIAVGDEFRVAAKGAIDGGTAIENVFAQMVTGGTFEPVFAEIRNFADRLGVDLNDIATSLPEAFKSVDWEPLIDSVKDLGGELVDLFNAFFGNIDLTTPEGLSVAINKVVDGATALTNVVGGILDAWEPFIKVISDGIDKFTESDEATQKLIGQFLGWAQVVNTVADNIGILTGSLNLIGGAISFLAITNIPSAVLALKGFTKAFGTAALGVSQFVAVIAAPVAGWAIGTWLRDNVTIVKEFGDNLGDLAFNIVHLGDDSIIAAESQAAHTKALGEARVEMVRVLEAAGKLPSQVGTEVTIEGTQAYLDEFETILAEIETLPAEKTTEIQVAVDESSFEQAKQYIIETGDDGITTIVFAQPDAVSFEATKTEIEKIPAEKEIEIKLQGEINKDIARIEAQAEILQSAFEWKAKVDITELETMRDIVTSLSGDVSDMFVNTGSVITGLAQALDGLSSYDRLQLFDLLDLEAINRAELLAIEKELTQAQVEYLQARTAALKGGKALITIKGENLEPELQLVLNRIIELTQVEATEQGLEFLVGV